MKVTENLNKNQIQAVTTNEQFVRVIAGAGSGKTRVLTNRIAYLIDEVGVPSERIIAFTFTNKAASEMLQRVTMMVEGDEMRTRLTTFHAFGARFLREEIAILGYTQHFVIYDEEDSQSLIKNLFVERGHGRGDDIVKEAISYISGQKGLGKHAEDAVIKFGGSQNESIIIEIWQRYEKKLKAYAALDFNDLLNKTILILNKYAEVREKWQERFDHILVDEFQDTDDVQYEMIKLLMSKRTSLYVVGDPDQTIYTWRGANEHIILDLAKEYPIETIILDENYRSTQLILDSANRLINHNKYRVHKDLYSSKKDGEPVIARFAFTETQEAQWVYEQINLMKLNYRDFSYRQVVILLRANYLTLPFEKCFMRNNVNYVIYGGIRFYQRKVVKDILAYLRILYNPKDDISFERICNTPRRGLGKKGLESLKITALQNEFSLLETVRHIDDLGLSASPHANLKHLSALIDKTIKRINEKEITFDKIVSDYIEDVGYFEYVEQLRDIDSIEAMLDNIHTLIKDIKQFTKNSPDASFEDYLENVALLSAQDEVTGGEYITIMTVHMAKGLEFDYVFVAALNQGVFPNNRAITEGGDKALEEERRLCYVAFTRAKKKLYVSTSGSFNYSLGANSEPSQFFNEAGIERPKVKPYDKRYGTPRRNEYNSNAPQFSLDSDDDFVSDFPFAVNDIVVHNKFGEGVVTEIYPSQGIVDVRFDQHGQKKLQAGHPAFKKRQEA